MKGQDELRGLPVTVMGLGLFGGGVGVARWLCERGARVTVTDLRSAASLQPSLDALADLPIEYVLGRHRPEDFAHAGWIVANPAVPPKAEWLELARQSGARITSEIALLLEHLPARAIAITGTQGKSSTTSFTAQLLSCAGYRVHAGGNLGGSLLSKLDELGPRDVVVLELSSYQLEALAEPTHAAEPQSRVEAVAIVNILRDHLERHGDRQTYVAAKLRILDLLQPGGTAILPREFAAARPERLRRTWMTDEGSQHSGLAIQDGRFYCEGIELARVSDLAIPGQFQRQNVLVALGLARVLGVAAVELARALPKLRSLPHRMQDLGTYNGVRVIDNGVSTTPDSTLAALAEIQGACTLLLGGKQKLGLEFDELANLALHKGVRVVTFGAAGEAIAASMRAAQVASQCCTTLAEAVQQAFCSTAQGATLLFSPAAASFDAYANFEARAREFQNLIRERSGHTAEPRTYGALGEP